MLRIVIADDHGLIREGLRKVLGREADMQIVGEAPDFPALASLLESVRADAVIMDVNMPGPGAIAALKRLRAVAPGAPVIALSMMPEREVGFDLLAAGAAAFLSKESAPEELAPAIRKACSDYRHVDQSLAQRAEAQAGAGALSPREREVLRLIARGLSVKEIAAQLLIGISTVHTHRARLRQKLKLRSDVELSGYALRRLQF
jgi:two-component system, NarL family, invasion response regulator UvrY